ncbi:MAG: aspartate-semialdehyde dehydrogenase [Bacillota bacterium]|nr:aspartate-semialdehyde dehydrogenase [Bacillota bacterium]
MLRVAVVGATGAVGREIVSAIFELEFPVSDLILASSPRSAGSKVSTPMGEITVTNTEISALEGADVAFLAAGASVSRKLAPELARRGTLVIDNSSAFRMDPEVPLVVPEVNIDAVHEHRGIIANPNCSTIIAVVAVAPIYRRWGLERMIVSTYQAVSGAGHAAIEALADESEAVLAGLDPLPSVLPYKSAEVHHQIAFNVIPHVDSFCEDGYTREEYKMTDEIRKILQDPSLKISATCVRVPVFRSHSESINLQTCQRAPMDEVRAVLASSPGIRLMDDPASFAYPMPIHVSGKDDVEVGRLREDPSAPNAMWLWVVGDQLRKGAASNAVQIGLALYDDRR